MQDLTKANKLLKDISKKDRKISAVTPKDLPLFQKFFKKEPHTYGNSWTYVTQGKYGIGPYGLGYKYYDGENLSSLSIYPHMERKDILCIYWTRPMGLNILNIIADYSKYFFETHLTPTYVKKIFESQYTYLLKKGFKDTIKFPWHKNYPSEDDSYPEIIIDVKKTLENVSHRETIRNALKRYRSLDQIAKVKNISNASDKMKAWKVAKEFFYQDIYSLTENISTSNDYFNVIFKSDYPSHELYLIYQDGFPRGAFDLNKLSDGYYSIYMSLMLREELRNLNEFSVIFRCKRVLQQKGSYINMGGSETEGLHQFKNKFHVYRTNKMYWSVFY